MQLRVTTQCESRGKGREPGPAAAAVVIHNAANGRIMLATGFYLGEITQQEAEFQGLIRGIEAAKSIGADELQVLHTNADLISLVTGATDTDDAEIEPLLAQVQMGLLRFDLWQLRRTDSAITGHRVEMIEQAITRQRDIVAKSEEAEAMPPLSKDEAEFEGHGDHEATGNADPDALLHGTKAKLPADPSAPLLTTTGEPVVEVLSGDEYQAKRKAALEALRETWGGKKTSSPSPGSDAPAESDTPAAATSPIPTPSPDSTVDEGSNATADDTCDPAEPAVLYDPSNGQAREKRCPRFEMQLAQVPGDACPMPLKQDKWYRFGPGTPQGVCLYAAREALNQTLYSQGQSPQWLAECSRCGVWLQIVKLEE